MSDAQLLGIVYGSLIGGVFGWIVGPRIIEWFEDRWYDLIERIRPSKGRPVGYCTDVLLDLKIAKDEEVVT